VLGILFYHIHIDNSIAGKGISRTASKANDECRMMNDEKEKR
jgi:hypothetical protein